MDILKKVFPFSFKPLKDVASLVISVIIYVVAMIVAGVIIGVAAVLTGNIDIVGPLLGLPLGLASALIELYCVAGIVIRFLTYFNVIKDQE